MIFGVWCCRNESRHLGCLGVLGCLLDTEDSEDPEDPEDPGVLGCLLDPEDPEDPGVQPIHAVLVYISPHLLRYYHLCR